MIDHEIKVVCPVCGAPSYGDERTIEVAGIECSTCRARAGYQPAPSSVTPRPPAGGSGTMPRAVRDPMEEGFLAALSHGRGDVLCIGSNLEGWLESRFDMVLVDGARERGEVVRDVVAAIRSCRTMGIIVFRDWIGGDGVPGSVRSVVGDSAPLFEVPIGSGLVVLVVTPELKEVFQ